MKSAAISRFVVVAAVLALMSLSTTLLAQISFHGLYSANIASLTPNGSAEIAGNADSTKVLRLTPDGSAHVSGSRLVQHAAAGYRSFSTTSKFRITHNSSAGVGRQTGSGLCYSKFEW